MTTPLPPPIPERYFKPNHLRLSWCECWHMFSWRNRIGAAVLKLFRIPLPLTQGFPSDEDDWKNSVAESGLPNWARRRLAGPLAELVAAGFHSPRFVMPKNLLAPNLYSANAALLHQEAEMWALVIVTLGMAVKPHSENLVVVISSVLGPGISIVTTNAPRSFDPPPGNEIVRRLGATVQSLVTEHRQRLERTRQHRPITPVRTPDELVRVKAENYRRLKETMLARGVWVIMTDAEVATLCEQIRGLPVPPLPPDA